MMKLNKQEKDNLICVGSIGKARGLKGEFFLNSFCSPKENILNYSNFIIENNEVSEFKIKYVKKANTKFISKINKSLDHWIKITTNVILNYLPCVASMHSMRENDSLNVKRLMSFVSSNELLLRKGHFNMFR